MLHLSDFELDEVVNVGVNRLHCQVLLLFELLLQQHLLFTDFVSELPVHPIERIPSEVELGQVEHSKAVEEEVLGHACYFFASDFLVSLELLTLARSRHYGTLEQGGLLCGERVD